ncbi:MAG: hypothetical protein ACE5G5_09075 [Candidatus Methylomirabilales bacterium]
MKRKLKAVVPALCAFLVLALVGSPAWGGQGILLNDAELDQVYGGEPSEENDPLVVLRSCGTCSLVIDSSQTHTSAVILVNAVNSVVGAQVNMIANMGTVGHATQMNFSTATTP